MGIDNQGKSKGESLTKGNQRGNENKVTPVSQQVNRTKDKVKKVVDK